MENKRCIKRCVLFNSAGFAHADIRQDGHIDIAGGSGTGKSTLLNALLFPFIIENRLLNIGSEKDEFAKYYFGFSNSFIFYEIVNRKGAEYCAVLHKTYQDALVFHVVNAAFDEKWLYNDEEGNEPVNSWDELAKNIGPALARGSYNREAFNRVLFGVDSDYSESLSIMKFDGKKMDEAKATSGIRNMLSIILCRRELSQAALKKTLVDAVLSENQSKTDGIMLATHRKNLGDFISRKQDIDLATKRDEEGKTVLEILAQDIFDMVDDYALTQKAINDTPGELAYAMDKADKKSADLKGKLDTIVTRQKELTEDYDGQLDSLSKEIEARSAERAVAEDKVKTLREYEAKYKECDNVEDLVRYAPKRKELDAQKTQYTTALSQLNANAEDIRSRERNEIDRIKNVYQDKINKSNNAAVAEKERLNKTITDAQTAYDTECRNIEGRYRPLIEAAGSSVADALELVLRAVRETESELTIEELRGRLNGDGQMTENIEGIILEVSSHHNPSGMTGMELSDLEKKTIADYNEKRAKVDILNRQKEEETAAAARNKSRIIEEANNEIACVEKKRKENYKAIETLYKEEEREVKKTYSALLSGNDKAISGEVEELNEKLESVEYILEQLNLFPSVADDYRMWLSRAAELRETLTGLTNTLQELRKRQSELKNEKIVALDAIEAEKTSVKADFDATVLLCQRGRQFIANRLSVREAIEGGARTETEKGIAEILGDYELCLGKVDEFGKNIPQAVRHLFDPGLLTPVDTFSLGYGSTSTLEDCLTVADNLRALLQETVSGGTLLDNHIRTNATIWIHELQSISIEMTAIETNMALLREDCRKANRFMDANNTTDCCGDIRLDIDENASIDLLLILKKINEFWYSKGHLVGYDNLFVDVEDNDANTDAVELLKEFAKALAEDLRNEIPLSDMFDIKLAFREKGNYHTNLMKFDNPASGSTNVMLKSIINIALLKVLVDANRNNAGVAFSVPVEEMNDISIVNLKAFIRFADAAGMHLVFCGQHHTIPADMVKYSYNTWDELIPMENGKTLQKKWIDMEGESSLIENEDE